MSEAKEKKNKNSQSGQFILEGILLMVLFTGIALMIKNQFTEKTIIGALVAGPWASVQQMMSNGTWDKSKTEGESHPLIQTISREGDTN